MEELNQTWHDMTYECRDILQEAAFASNNETCHPAVTWSIIKIEALLNCTVHDFLFTIRDTGLRNASDDDNQQQRRKKRICF